jgi:DNA-binding LacI/PurR family transcriptional regulator
MLRQAGRRVPDDVAVIGFDDNVVAAYADPPLTTVRQPIQDLGRGLARQLLRLLDGEDVEDAYMLPTQLVIRESA